MPVVKSPYRTPALALPLYHLLATLDQDAR
jgi:hypothetical protein